MVAPAGNREPEAGAQDGPAVTPTTSIAVAAGKTTATPSRLVAASITSAGGVTTGAVVSCTVTTNVPVPMFPWASVAEQATVVRPNGNSEPEAGTQDTATGPSTTSDADGLV